MLIHSPAKINLFLKIVRRRPDGYHELASLFQTINLFDKLYFELSDADRFTCTDATLPTDGSNLVLKALSLFRHKTKIDFHVNVHLEKHIPHQAGLGGGSSNAASTLWALNQLNGCPATTDELCTWAAEIGSDVPFFLSEGTAYCTGRGEQVENLPKLPHSALWIVKPPKGLSTPEVYRTLNLSELIERDHQQTLDRFFRGHFECFNDLEGAAFKVMPQLAVLKSELMNFGPTLMCGSGSSFFCLSQHKPVLDQKANIYPAKFINRVSHSWYSEI